MSRTAVKRALISVYDKTKVVELASALSAEGVELVSTGSTARMIEEAGIPVTPVEQVTGFPECLNGRVKTLHPRIHAGILADRTKPEHVAELAELEVEAFDLVVVNLYPFQQTIASGASFAEAIEQIDIGGPTMVRAAAKNHASVAVVIDPSRYDEVIEAVQAGGFTLEQRQRLAADAFAHTATYDAAVSTWFAGQIDEDDAPDPSTLPLPGFVAGTWRRLDNLRYGENPHQRGAVYVNDGAGFAGRVETGGLARAKQLHGKAMSYNNYTDADAALRAAYDHEEPCVAIIKHANPCGIAIGKDVAEAHRKAHACDPVSAFGGVIAVNRPVTVEMAEQVAPIFTEVVVAPSFEDDALEVLTRKKNIRILTVEPPSRGAVEFKQITGGLVAQGRDDVNAPGDDPSSWQLVSGKPADERTLADLKFAWTTVRAVRSNAILLVKDEASVGVGMGQVNRVDSCALAVERANTLGGRETGDAAKVDAGVGGASSEEVLSSEPPRRSEGAVAASDAFFPFADGLQILIDAGVKAVVQPGGSIRDEEVIEAAKAAGITMYLTGNRHFSH